MSVQDLPFKRHEPLYLKYRPQALGELVGQEGVYRTLVNAIENDRLTHAYLFTGPRGTGKTSSARILAKSLNCKTAEGKSGTVTPCQTCSCCVEITHGNSPAVFEIDAASNNSVDDARVLIERAPLVAVGGQYKVYIIDECHMLTKEAFNALLKTIEQPPPNVVFILATTEEHKVLPTIISRCQRLMFKLINQDALFKHLRHVADSESIEIEDEAVQLIARRSGGGLRDALSNLDQASLLASPGSPATVSDLLRLLGALHEDVLLNLSKQIAERAGQSVIDSVNQFLAEGREPQVVLQELSRHFLNLMKASYLSGSKPADASTLSSMVLGSESYINGLSAQSQLFEKAELSQIIEQIDRLEQTCRRSSQPAMHLEIGLLSICHRHEIHLVKDLLARVQRLEEQMAGGGPAPAHHAPVARAQAPAPAPSRPAAPSYAAAAAPAPAPAPMQAPAAPISSQNDSAEIRSISLAHEAEASLPAPSRSLPQPDERQTEPQPRTAPEPRPVQAAAKPSPGSSSDDPRVQELNGDIEYFWQQVLDELQRRHLPTFSLASTHAFPLQVTASEFSIGVLKENFQKMLETKADHLRTASQAVSGMELGIRIRVAEGSAPAPKAAVAAPARSAAPSRQESNDDYPEARSAQSGSAPGINAGQPATDAGSAAEPQTQRSSNPGDPNSEPLDSSTVKEAYKLFEGPGSRRIN